MKRITRAVFAVSLAFLLSGCATVVVEGPAGDPIRLASTGRATTKVASFKTWYLFWGMMPLGDNSTAAAVQEAKFKVVRVVTKIAADDFLLGLVGVIPFVPVSRTVEVWGE
jgi:hypothetical protein